MLISKGTFIDEKYEVMEPLGNGGFADTYLAWDIRLKRNVAMKILNDRQFVNPISQKRFIQEVDIIARLSHRDIVTVHDYGEYEGKPYLIMRFMEGGTLRELLKTQLLPLERICNIVKVIASALTYIHSANIIHRDIKPENILLDLDENVYLADFGIALILEATSQNLTKTGHAVGSYQYMAPEQWQDGNISSRTDVYQFGITVFEMLTGRRPFHGENAWVLMHKHCHEEVPSVNAFNPKLSKEFDAILSKALAKEPTERFDSVEEFAESLISVAKKTHPEILKETDFHRLKSLMLLYWKWILAGCLSIMILFAAYDGYGGTIISLTLTPTQTVTVQPILEPSSTNTSTVTWTPTITQSPTSSYTSTNTQTPTFTATATITPTNTATPSDTPTSTFTPTATLRPSPTRTPTSTPTSTFSPPQPTIPPAAPSPTID
ncbi:MAG: protein kinase [Anaerolineae bacterium]|nr:protein kinase [Anaerolineae bacterium]